MPHRNLRILFAAILLCYVCYVRADHNPLGRHLALAFHAIDRYALERVPPDALLEGGVRGMVAQLNDRGDEHSAYISARRAAEFYADIDQEFGGVGVLISLRGDPPQLVVVAPPEPNTPASKHDVRAGDRIVAIDGQLTEKNKMQDILARMRGPVGESVRITLERGEDGATHEEEIVRDRIKLDSVKGIAKGSDAQWSFRLEEDRRIAHVRLTSFAEQTLDDLSDTLRELLHSGVEAVILDLRHNAGGELGAAVGISELFLDAGDLIVTIKDRHGRARSREIASGRGEFYGVPMAVLIDRDSASASEIVAAALQDHRRATVIGERSFGKGTVQRLIPIGPPAEHDSERRGGVLKLTTDSYWRPSGENIHRLSSASDQDQWGVTPDDGFVFSLTDEQYEAYRIDRGNRDIFNPHGDALLDIPDGDPDSGDNAEPPEDPKPLVDTILQRAVEHLQSQLSAGG